MQLRYYVTADAAARLFFLSVLLLCRRASADDAPFCRSRSDTMRVDYPSLPSPRAVFRDVRLSSPATRIPGSSSRVALIHTQAVYM